MTFWITLPLKGKDDLQFRFAFFFALVLIYGFVNSETSHWKNIKPYVWHNFNPYLFIILNTLIQQALCIH